MAKTLLNLKPGMEYLCRKKHTMLTNTMLVIRAEADVVRLYNSRTGESIDLTQNSDVAVEGDVITFN